MVLTKGEVVVGTRSVVDSALGVGGGVTAATVAGTVAGLGAGVTMDGDCSVVVVVVVDVVVAAPTVGGKGVIFLVGGGMVGVGGLNFTMEYHKWSNHGKEEMSKKGRG